LFAPLFHLSIELRGAITGILSSLANPFKDRKYRKFPVHAALRTLLAPHELQVVHDHHSQAPVGFHSPCLGAQFDGWKWQGVIDVKGVSMKAPAAESILATFLLTENPVRILWNPHGLGAKESASRNCTLLI
jgi:hypothetical protein